MTLSKTSLFLYLKPSRRSAGLRALRASLANALNPRLVTGSYGLSFAFSSFPRAKSAADLEKASATSSSVMPKFVM